MYALKRLIKRVVKEADDWIEYIKRYDKNTIHITDDEFVFLNSLQREYNYVTYDNELYVDRHPDMIKEGVSSVDFLSDYQEHLSDKFFVLYEYEKVE